METTKSWFKSKLVWLGTIIALYPAISDYITSNFNASVLTSKHNIIAFASGLAVVVVRIFFTTAKLK